MLSASGNAGIPEIRALLADEYADFVPALTPCWMRWHTDLIHLQERYVQTFDRTPSHSLHLFEHVQWRRPCTRAGDGDLLDEYRKHGFDVMDSCRIMCRCFWSLSECRTHRSANFARRGGGVPLGAYRPSSFERQ